ncbi:MAG: efflux RND transporter permease subunit, partial [Leptospiraceae bacterium]|nr:efflux RND transporter permease subunit [Leptospiraceae bacterium]
NVTRKLEESLEEVEGIDYFESESMENLSSIQIHLDQRLSDFEETNDEIRRAVEKVGDLPSEVTDDPEVIVMDTADMTIYEVALAGDMDLSQIKPYADRLKDALLELPDVSRVEEKGVPSSEIQILLNKEALNEHFISFGEVIDAIRANKIRLSGGSLESYTSSVGIVTLSDFRTIDDIERIIIRSNDAGQAIRLKDVAEVKAGIEAMDKSVRINGKPGMYLGVAAREGSDILDVVESVVRRVEQFRTDENLPAGLALTSLRDESIETKIRLNIVLQNAVAGFVLVMAVLFFFFNRRIAFWTAAGIPIAIAVALIGIPFLDITINRISLLGLIVVLGMLVDDSIIIAESIYTEMQSGKPPEEAAASGLSKVIRPVISTVITTVFAFVPMYFLGGPVGDFSMEIPTVVILMLVGSLLEALFILPVHLGHAGMPEGGLVEPPGAKLIAGLERRYSRLL